MTQPIFLVGLRGCGKSTVGFQLSRARHSLFVDTDRWLQAQAGETIAELIKKEGWENFRVRESVMLEKVTTPSTVISTSGGIVLSSRNRDFMRLHGIVVYLFTPASILVDRLDVFSEENNCPVLSPNLLRVEIEDTLIKRDALYRAIAHHVVDASVSPQQIVALIIAALRTTATLTNRLF